MFKIIKYMLYGVVIFVSSYIIISFVGQKSVVDGDSMNPTLNDGDNLLVEKLSYRFGEIKRNDIVVFKYTGVENTSKYYIKRIIGLPGEIILIRNGIVYKKDEKTGEFQPLEDIYGFYLDDKPMDGGIATEPLYIPNDSYFVLGDNRNNSNDSRAIGVIKKESIIGRAVFRFSPLKNMGFIK